MKKIISCCCLLLSLAVLGQPVTETYPVDPASVEQAGVPKGELIKFSFTQSRIYPGTVRDCWVYVPAQYQSGEAACVYVNQDGIQWKAPTVFDNLIAAKEIPVIIGIFVTPGRVLATDEATGVHRYNRSFEYDGLGDAYARFLLTELFPAVEQQRTSDGRIIRLSTSGNDRAIGGSSSGAVCAFTAAWERPDAFTRVFSAIGTYVGLRGADRYSTLVRKYTPKPLRIFLQDGSNDLNIYAGDWWKANESMERALVFSGYEVNHVWGEGAHNGNQGTAVFPQAMRWLWKDWPTPVAKGTTRNQVIKDVLIMEEEWKEIPIPAAAPSARLNTIARSTNGNVYTIIRNTIQLAQPGGKKSIVAKDKLPIAGIALTPDQTQLYVAEGGSHWIAIYSIQPGGGLINRQRLGWLHSPDDADHAGAGGIACDTAGRVYVATTLGIQVLDQLGRVNAILPLPGNSAAMHCYFEGTELRVLAGNGTWYSRKLRTKGVAGELYRPQNPRL